MGYKLISVAKGHKFRPQTPKGAAKKSEGPEKLAVEFFPDLHKKGRKGTELFPNLLSQG
jgi:hypothetical protein